MKDEKQDLHIFALPHLPATEGEISNISENHFSPKP